MRSRLAVLLVLAGLSSASKPFELGPRLKVVDVTSAWCDPSGPGSCAAFAAGERAFHATVRRGFEERGAALGACVRWPKEPGDRRLVVYAGTAADGSLLLGSAEATVDGVLVTPGAEDCVDEISASIVLAPWSALAACGTFRVELSPAP